MIDKPTVGRLPIGKFLLPICLRWPTGLVVTYRVFRYTCTGAHPPPTKVSHSHKPAQGFKRLIAILNWYSFWFNKEKIITAFKIQGPYQHLTCERDLLYMCLLNSWAFAYQYQNVCKEEGFLYSNSRMWPSLAIDNVSPMCDQWQFISHCLGHLGDKYIVSNISHKNDWCRHITRVPNV